MNNDAYFKEKLQDLPDYVRWAIEETDYASDLEAIKKKYRLHIDQSSVLEKLGLDFILGEIDQAGFVESLFHDGRISYQMAGDILADINGLIIKKIKDKIAVYREEEQAVKDNENFYMDDKEREIEEMSTLYQQQDEEYVKIQKDIEEQEKQNGPITDADIAREQGITLAEYLAQNKPSEGPTLKTAVPTENHTENVALSEKEELLKELETPEKSFKTPLIQITPKKDIQTTKPETVIAPIQPDHQLQNTHLEEPYKAPEIHPEKPVVETSKQNPPQTTPIIQKPAKIEIKHDIYREPIE